MSLGEVNDRLARFAARINNPSERDQLRSKVQQLVRELNGGVTTVQYGPLHIDIFVQFERMLNGLSDSKVSRALQILRE